MASLMLWWIVSTFTRPAVSLPDAAWREALRRAAVGTPVAVITLASLPPSAAATSPGVPTPTADVGPESRSTDDGVGESWWRARMAAARAQVSQARERLDQVDGRLAALTRDVVAMDDPVQRERLQQDRQRALLEREDATTAVAQAEAGVALVEEAARRAGVPPGWIR